MRCKMSTWNDGTMVLMHHGIKGQKWGVRRFQNPDGTYTPEGKARRNESLGTTIKNKWNGLSDKQKTMIKVGAAVAATALVAYGAYKVGAFKAVAKVGKAAANKIVNSNAAKKVSDFVAKKTSAGLEKIVTQTAARKARIPDEVLRETKDRLQLEADVRKLEREALNKGSGWVKETMTSIAKKTAVQVGTSAAVAAAITWLNGEEVDLSKMKLKKPTPKDKW